jgi:hypothetical protein
MCWLLCVPAFPDILQILWGVRKVWLAGPTVASPERSLLRSCMVSWFPVVYYLIFVVISILFSFLNILVCVFLVAATVGWVCDLCEDGLVKFLMFQIYATGSLSELRVRFMAFLWT